jgi:hypothetical protein
LETSQCIPTTWPKISFLLNFATKLLFDCLKSLATLETEVSVTDTQ